MEEHRTVEVPLATCPRMATTPVSCSLKDRLSSDFGGGKGCLVWPGSGFCCRFFA